MELPSDFPLHSSVFPGPKNSQFLLSLDPNRETSFLHVVSNSMLKCGYKITVTFQILYEGKLCFNDSAVLSSQPKLEFSLPMSRLNWMKDVCIKVTLLDYGPENYHDIPHYKKNFTDLLSSGNFADIVLQCKDKEIRCHSAILAVRCPGFAKFVQNNKDQSGTVMLKHFDTTEIKLYMSYIYTDIFPYCPPFQLLSVAKEFEDAGLKAALERYIDINIFNVMEVMKAAWLHDAKKLLDRAIYLTVGQLPTVEKFKGLRNLKEQDKHLAHKVLEANGFDTASQFTWMLDA